MTTTKPNPKHKYFKVGNKKMPRLYSLPDAKECKLQDPRHCQHAEGMRLAGYGDPVVFQNDRLEIRAIANGHRLVFSPNAQQFVSAKQFDAGQPEAAGTVFDLGHPISITPIKKQTVINRKKRRDAGMSKARADIVFNRKPGQHAGRRARFLLKVVKVGKAKG